LPTAAPPAEVWAAIERRTRAAPRRVDWRWVGVATAAALALAIGVVAYERRGAANAPADIPALVARSQSLERRIARVQSSARWGDGRAALVYRIADLDRELAPLALDPVRDPRRAEALWRQRIALMQSLSELDATDASSSGRTVAF
jgi:hypothetical protein